MAYVMEDSSPAHADTAIDFLEVAASHGVEVEVLETVPVETMLGDDRAEASGVGTEERLLPFSLSSEGKLLVLSAILPRRFFSCCLDILLLYCLFRTYRPGGEAAVE